MKIPFSQRTWSTIAVCAIGFMLAALAILQYRWSQDISEAAGARMRASLESSVIRFREDFSRELGNLAVAVQTDSSSVMDPEAAADYVQRIDTWKRTASHPDLLQSIYVFERRRDEISLYRLNLQKIRFEPTVWPSSLEPLRQSLGTFSLDVALIDQHARRVEDRRQVPHDQHPPDALVRGNDHLRGFGQGDDGETQDFRPESGPAALPRDRRVFRGFPRMPWLFDEAGAVLIRVNIPHPIPDSRQAPPDAMGVLIELNQGVIIDQILPQLALSHFSKQDGLEYDVAVVDRSHNNDVIYASTFGFGTGRKLVPDAEASVIGNFVTPDSTFAAPPLPPNSGPVITSTIRGEARFLGVAGPVRLERYRFQERGPGWVLIAKHRKGSLEAALTSMHRRQLAISFGVLALLAVTIALIIVATRRAQNLAKLQMDFVTGVSHELRTPLAVIGSAAENIADGIIDDKTKLKRYGAAIRDQSRHLTQLVEQILQFAATRRNGYQYNLSEAAPSEIVKLALNDSAELIRTTGFTVDQNIEENLPPVMIDVPAVSHCLQNLITNAIKYSGESRSVSLRARKARIDKDRFEIQISIEDKGIGIARSDLHRIFDPFYRSPAVASAQIHGTGLGLALARSIAEAMGGHLSVASELGKGSTFTLHLPCMEILTTPPNHPETEAEHIYYEPERSNR